MADKNMQSDTPPAEKDLPYKALDYTKDRKQIDELKAKAMKHAEKEVMAFRMEDQIYTSLKQQYHENNSPATYKRLEAASKRRDESFQPLKEKVGEVLRKEGLLYAEDTHGDPKHREFIKASNKRQPVHPEMVIIDKRTKMYADDILMEMAQDIQKSGKKTLDIENALPPRVKEEGPAQGQSR